MPLSIESLIALVGKPVRGIHYSLGEVSGELQKIDAHTLLGAIADARFKDSPALTRGLVWVDINTICPKETIGGAGFVLHHSPEPEERQVQRRAELEPISNQATDNDSLIEEIAEGRKTIQFAYVPTAIDSSRPFIDPASQSMLGILLEDMKQDLVSLKMPPVAVACIPELYQELGKKYPGGIENVESIGLKIYQRDDLSMPGEEPYKAAFRLFFDEEELWLFLNSDRQSISQPHFSRSMMEQSSTEYSQDVAHKTDDFLKSFTDKLSDL